MRLDLALDQLLPHPVEAVWGALTDAEAIAEWLMVTSDFRPEVGTRFRLKTRNLSATGWVDAEVLQLDPPRRMVWSWSANGATSRVTFELEPEGDSTRLRLTHRGGSDPVVGRLLGAGWPSRIELLAGVVAGQRRTDG